MAKHSVFRMTPQGAARFYSRLRFQFGNHLDHDRNGSGTLCKQVKQADQNVASAIAAFPALLEGMTGTWDRKMYVKALESPTRIPTPAECVPGRSSLANQPVVTLKLKRLFVRRRPQYQVIAMALHLNADIDRLLDLE
jgi:hypothetical protein